MSALTLLLIWTTFLELYYGMEVSRFAVYNTYWFAALLGLLGLNILVSVVLRFPWKRRHIPFLLAHVGILILLFGCWMTWMWGEEATMSLYEGQTQSVAIQKEQCFDVRSLSMTARNAKESETEQAETLRATNSFDRDTLGADRTVFSFAPGPFSWNEYNRKQWFDKSGRENRLISIPLYWMMKFSNRDRGVLRPTSDSATPDDISIEILDYYADTKKAPTFPLELAVRFERPLADQTRTEDSGTADSNMTESSDSDPNTAETPRSWETLSLQLPLQSYPTQIVISPAVRQRLAGGESVVYFATDSRAEVEAFRDSAPRDLPGNSSWGQLVLNLRGKTYPVSVTEILEQAAQGKMYALADTGYRLELVRFEPRDPLIQLFVHAPCGLTTRLLASARSPESNLHARLFGLFVTYWYDAPTDDEKGAQTSGDSVAGDLTESFDALGTGVQNPDGVRKPRIDLLQGPDRKLFYRYWTGRTLASAGEIPTQPGKGGVLRSEVLNLATGTPDAVDLGIDKFVPSALPGYRFEPVEIRRHEKGKPAEPMALLRVTVGGESETFWLRSMLPLIDNYPPQADQVRYFYHKDRTICVLWNHRQIDFDFGIRLRKADSQTEPGTSHKASYSSLVDQMSLEDNPYVLQGNVLIRMNRPGIFRSPGKGRTYRFYQSQMVGPFRPGDIRYQSNYDAQPFEGEPAPRESLYLSGLSVNYDPGRGWKYLGSFLLLVGIGALILRAKPGGGHPRFTNGFDAGDGNMSTEAMPLDDPGYDDVSAGTAFFGDRPSEEHEPDQDQDDFWPGQLQ